jgi:hypothetical protein
VTIWSPPRATRLTFPASIETSLLGASWRRNETQLRRLFLGFRLAATLLVGEIVFWVLALANQS